MEKSTNIPNIYIKKSLTGSLSIKSEYFINGIHIDNEFIATIPEKLPLVSNNTLYPDELFSEFICRYNMHDGGRYALWKDHGDNLFQFSEKCFQDTFKKEIAFFKTSAGEYLSCRSFSQYILEIEKINNFSLALNKLSIDAFFRLMFGLYPSGDKDPVIFKNLHLLKNLKDEFIHLNRNFITFCLPPEIASVIGYEETQFKWLCNQIVDVSESDYIYECPDPDEKCRRIFLELYEREIISKEDYNSKEIQEYVFNIVLARELYPCFFSYICQHELCGQDKGVEYNCGSKLLLSHFLCFDSPLNQDISMNHEQKWLTAEFKKKIISTIENFMGEYGEDILISIKAFEKDFKESNIKHINDKVWSSLPDVIPTL
jgi:hypothetical protein